VIWWSGKDGRFPSFSERELMRVVSVVAVLLFATVSASRASRAATPADAEQTASETSVGEPTDHYEQRQVDGWTVLVNKRLFDEGQHAVCDRTLRLLDDH
jgi:hypothetical protein